MRSALLVTVVSEVKAEAVEAVRTSNGNVSVLLVAVVKLVVVVTRK